MKTVQRLIALILLLTSLLSPQGNGSAQAPEDLQYFPETGHSVKGEFLRFYNEALNPELVFGAPITEQITSRDGKVVQYFQNARLEYVTGLSGVAAVQLTPLGQVTYRPGSQKLDINNPSACRSFQTGFPVCFAFLDFYEANSGEAQFGSPISPFEFQENLIVQYFEKARFEWHADRPEGQRVVLTDLGRIYFDSLGEDQIHLRPIRPLDATISPILSIRARAFVKNTITLSSGQQTVHIVVLSQTNQPVPNANGKASIHFTGGQTEVYYFTTNAAGLGSVTFSFEDQKQGELVPIRIIVTYQGLADTTTTSYRIWY